MNLKDGVCCGRPWERGRGYAFIVAAVLAAIISGAKAADNEGEAAKEAIKEKQGEQAKAERDAALEKMRSFEAVTPALEIAVLSCRPAKIPAPSERGESGNVNVSGEGWAALAGALLSAANESASPSRDRGGDGRVLVQVDIMLKNTSSTTLLVRPEDFALSTPEGYTVSYNLRTYDTARPLAGVNLPPGGTTGGLLVFVLEPFDEYALHYYNAAGAVAGVKRVLLMKGD